MDKSLRHSESSYLCTKIIYLSKSLLELDVAGNLSGDEFQLFSSRVSQQWQSQ